MLKCSLCINDEKTAKIKIVDGRPLCKECMNYLAHKPNKEKIKAELEELMSKVDKAIAAFSGGKDSTVALYLAKEKYKVDVEAVMIDHGFMAKEAIENAKRITEHLDVPLTVLRYDYSNIFRGALLKVKSPCKKCSSRTMGGLKEYALKKGVKFIITGHELPFGHRPYKIIRGGIIQIRLLSLMSEKERFKILEKLPFKFPDLPGYTTNCLIIGPALRQYYEKHGYSFEIRRIAALVRYRLINTEKALKKVSKPEISEEIEREVYKRLGIEKKD
ncbi:7-cyano-7-deazaguanine synthase [Thermococcus sibiricus]|nr:7-cyano-7-deazaguanine synthase [Thermococcus sibiricus]